MAAVTNVNLHIDYVNASDRWKVRVGYALAFEPAEVGLPYQVSIDLMGDDSNEVASGPTKPIYSFGFPLKRYKDVLGFANTGKARPFFENVEIRGQVLDEDPATEKLILGNVVKFPQVDEVFARVTLAAKPAIPSTKAAIGISKSVSGLH